MSIALALLILIFLAIVLGFVWLVSLDKRSKKGRVRRTKRSKSDDDRDPFSEEPDSDAQEEDDFVPVLD
jgi:hypothetical protein